MTPALAPSCRGYASTEFTFNMACSHTALTCNTLTGTAFPGERPRERASVLMARLHKWVVYTSYTLVQEMSHEELAALGPIEIREHRYRM